MFEGASLNRTRRENSCSLQRSSFFTGQQPVAIVHPVYATEKSNVRDRNVFFNFGTVAEVYVYF